MIRYTIFHSRDVYSKLASKRVAFQLKRYGDKPSVIFNHADSTNYLVMDDKSLQLNENGEPKPYTKAEAKAYLDEYFK